MGTHRGHPSWATIGVGRRGCLVQDVAKELGRDWHTVNKEIARWAEALVEADTSRFGTVEAAGVDKNRCSGGQSRWRTPLWEGNPNTGIRRPPDRPSAPTGGFLRCSFPLGR